MGIKTVMKKSIILTILGASALMAGAAEPGQVTLVDGTYSVDTVYHAKIGPGTTQTSLRLRGPHPLTVFYLTIDRGQAPDVQLRADCGNKLAGTTTVRNMAAARNTDTRNYFCGVNGDFYTTSGAASNGTSKVGTPTYACIVDGEIFKSSNGNYQFSVDKEGVARVSRLNFYKGMATCGDRSAEFHGVNVMSPNNSITLYTPRFWGSANQGDYAGASAEVTCRLVEGEKFMAGTKFKVEITGTPDSDGDAVIPDDGFVLFGRGTSKGSGSQNAIDFINGLKAGDIVEIDNAIYTAEGEKIEPLQVVSGNPKNVGAGVNLNSEAERGDASDRHPRTGIGVSADGNTIVMMVIDGRTTSSAGVTTGMLGDMLIYAGCHEGVNLDGGGSSTLYTDALGVRNHCSDGSERAVGNAIYATIDGDVKDTNVAEISFEDWRAEAPGLGVYTPVVYAYNAAGILIDTDYKDYILSCPAELGTISADGKSLYTGTTGKGILTATAGEATATIPVYITEAEARALHSTVIIDGIHPYIAQVTATSGGSDYTLRSDAFTWESSDTDIATVSADGTVTPVSNGDATITGRRGDIEVSFTASVQLPADHTMPIADTPEWWTLKKTSVSEATMTMGTDGSITINYTMSSSVRNALITLQANNGLWSRPDAILLEADYDHAPAKIEIVSRTAQARQLVTTAAPEVGETGTSWTYRLDVLGDLSDPASFPLFLSTVRFTPSEGAGENGRFTFRKLHTVYDAVNSGIENVTATEAAADGDARWYSVDGIEVNPDTMTPAVYIRVKGNKASKVFVK